MLGGEMIIQFTEALENFTELFVWLEDSLIVSKDHL